MCDCFCYICCVPEQNVAVVTRLGAYERMHRAGGPYRIDCCFESVNKYVSLQQQQMEISVRTKVDKAEVTLVVQVQYQVDDEEESIKSSVFKLSNPKEQINSYIQDVLRSAVSDLTVEQVFDTKDEIGQEVYVSLHEKMKEYGFNILKTLVTDVLPSPTVVKSFDLNNLSKFRKEADKFQQMINTSARNTQSEARKLRDEIVGNGISLQRQEIVNGLKTSIDAFTEEIAGVSPQDVLELVLVTQYFDMLKDVGVNKECKVLFTPGGQGSQADGLRDAILQSK